MQCSARAESLLGRSSAGCCAVKLLTTGAARSSRGTTAAPKRGHFRRNNRYSMQPRAVPAGTLLKRGIGAKAKSKQGAHGHHVPPPQRDCHANIHTPPFRQRGRVCKLPGAARGTHGDTRHTVVPSNMSRSPSSLAQRSANTAPTDCPTTAALPIRSFAQSYACAQKGAEANDKQQRGDKTILEYDIYNIEVFRDGDGRVK